MNKRKLISVLAVLLAIVIAVVAVVLSLQSCGNTGDKDKDTDTSKPSDSQGTDFGFKFEEGEENKPTNTGAPGGHYVINRKPVRVETDYTSIADAEEDIYAEETDNYYTYDLKVTTFDLNSFNVVASIKGVYFDNSEKTTESDKAAQANSKIDADKKITSWIKAISQYDSDIVAFQNLYPLMYHEKVGDVKITSEEVFSRVFKDYKVFDNGVVPDTSATFLSTLASKSSPYSLTDLSSGYLGKNSGSNILYVKGYMEVKGVKVAVYNVKIPTNAVNTQTKDAWAELMTLMNNEDYCIVMGNMLNSDEIAGYMQRAGFNAANRGKFGDFMSNTWSYGGNYCDNIFTTANIDIQYVELESSKKEGGFYRNPLTAYLKINTEMGSTKKTGPIAVDTDGFIKDWFKP